MTELKNKKVLVIGLGLSGRAACALLRRQGALVTGADAANTESLRRDVETLRADGVVVHLGATVPPDEPFDLVVLSPGVPPSQRLVREMEQRRVPIIGELELGYQHSQCLNVSITGTNGKTTTTELVERMLTHCGRKTVAAGNIGLPLCAVAEQTSALDILTLEVSSFQLETINYFRPAVAVLMNLTADHLDRYEGMTDYIRTKARLFANQQPFDWAIIQREALLQLQELGISIPSRIITFSAHDAAADIHLDGDRLVTGLAGWSSPLFDMSQGQLRGPHNAENLMAALAVGRVLQLPANKAIEALQTYSPAAHRCELVGELNGVRFINDSKATNLDAVLKAILTVSAANRLPNIWLIAGGKDKGFGFDGIGAALRERVKCALLIGETREKIHAAWSKDVTCEFEPDLTSAVTHAASKAVAGDVVLLSPACSSFDQFKNYQHRGEVFRHAVDALRNNTDRGCTSRQSSHNAMALGSQSARTTRT